MADFELWGKVVHAGPHDFLAMVSSVEVPMTTPMETVLLRTAHRRSRTAAERALEDLTRAAGAFLVEKGHRIVDVVIE